jgi:hypothetical protein
VNRNILDVKLRLRTARMARVRLLGTALVVAVGTVAGLYGLWRGGEWALDRLVFRNDSFAVRKIQVQSDGTIPAGEILRWSGVKVGDNVLALDLARVRRDLELVPVIRSAAVERVPPDSLRIRVMEREPVARVMAPLLSRTGSGVTIVHYYVDEAGYVMGWGDGTGEAPSYWRTNVALPVLEGMPGHQLRSGRVVTDEGVRAALRLASVFRESLMVGWVELESIDVGTGGRLEVRARSVAGGGVSRVRFGYEGMEEQMGRWRRIYDMGRRQGREILTLDLSVKNNVPVVFDEPGAEPEGAARIGRPAEASECHV